MNYFAHGQAFVDDPWFLAGTAIPDWLNVSDRGVRVRPKNAARLTDDADPRVAALARGITRHHEDDAWFHSTAAFAELSWGFTARLRNALDADEGMRPSFLGHILVEILLDASLIAHDAGRLDRYYRAVAAVDPGLVESTVNQISPQPAVRLAGFVSLFVRERFLSDYADDGKLCYRLNQVLRRVRLPTLSEGIREFLPEARAEIDARREELLSPGRIPAQSDTTPKP